MQTIALGWLALQLTGSGTLLGSIIAMMFLPILLLGAWGGVIADRFDKRRTIIYVQSALGALALILSILVFTGLIEVWMLYVFALCYGIVRAVDEPVRSTFVSELVDSNNLKNAVSLNSTANNLSRIVGPAIGGALIVGIGIAFAFLFNAISYGAVILTLIWMREEELHHRREGGNRAANIKEGLLYAWKTPMIRDLLLTAAIVGTFAYEWQVSLPLLAQRVFLGDAASYASLMSFLGVGAVLGGLVAASRHKIAPRNVMVYVFLMGLSMLATAFMPSLQLAMIGMMAVGFCSVNFTSLANTMIQLESAHEMRGRVMSLWTVAMLGSTAIGGPIIGFIGDNIGPRWGLAAGGFSALLAVGIATYPLLEKRFRAIPPEEPIQSSTSV